MVSLERRAALCFVVLAILWLGFSALPVSPASALDWPMFHHDLERTGVTPEHVTPPLALLWNSTIGYGVLSCPAVSGGLVYIGSYDYNVSALNATTGEKIWNYPTSGQVISSPAVSGGVVYIGSSYNDHHVYALNATTGAQIWNYTTGSNVWSSPAVCGGVVYVGSVDSRVYALNATTGAQIW
ncbi:MAG: PQQ-binding-like beta-propeller repeat protein, partial [Candidatus Bathyarchaeia archaeon]